MVHYHKEVSDNIIKNRLKQNEHDEKVWKALVTFDKRFAVDQPANVHGTRVGWVYFYP